MLKWSLGELLSSSPVFSFAYLFALRKYWEIIGNFLGSIEQYKKEKKDLN